MGIVCSFSGGKDSTYMVHLLLQQGVQIDAVVAFDTGWEFPEIYEHWDLFEKKTGLQIVRLRNYISFDYRFEKIPVKASKDYPERGVKKGEIHRYGYGWPSWTRRWCTREKVDALDKFTRHHSKPGAKQAIGFAADEKHRTNSGSQEQMRVRGATVYPLIEAGITEAQALEGCLRLGYHWDDLYDHMSRVSCFCCPLQEMASLRYLFDERPELWKQMLDMDSRRPEHNLGFRGQTSVHDLHCRFIQEREGDFVEIDATDEEPAELEV